MGLRFSRSLPGNPTGIRLPIPVIARYAQGDGNTLSGATPRRRLAGTDFQRLLDVGQIDFDGARNGGTRNRQAYRAAADAPLLAARGDTISRLETVPISISR